MPLVLISFCRVVYNNGRYRVILSDLNWFCSVQSEVGDSSRQLADSSDHCVLVVSQPRAACVTHQYAKRKALLLYTFAALMSWNPLPANKIQPYNRGPGAEPPVRSRGRAHGQRVRRQSSKSLCKILSKSNQNCCSIYRRVYIQTDRMT